LINEDVKVNDPVDISYVYNGYSPLSVKFIEAVMMSHGYKGMEESKYTISDNEFIIGVRMLPGSAVPPQNEFEFF
jgi:hypothetical protein